MRGFAEYLASCVLIIAIIGAIAWALTSRKPLKAFSFSSVTNTPRRRLELGCTK